jgi:hypothetical protein
LAASFVPQRLWWGGSAHSPRRRCAEPSHAGALAVPDRPRSIMATMRQYGNSTAATVLNHLPYRQCARLAQGFAHRTCFRMVLYKSLKIMDDSGLSPELSTRAVHGRHRWGAAPTKPFSRPDENVLKQMASTNDPPNIGRRSWQRPSSI